MPQPIKMKINLHVTICLVSAVGRATVSVMCFTCTGRSSTTGTKHLFLPQKVNFSENNIFTVFFSYTYMNMRSNILLHCDQKIQIENRIEI
jgi:hypothetical protein